MKYKVTACYPRDSDRPIANFADLNDAKLFIENKLGINQGLKVSVIYKIFEFDEKIEEYDPTKLDTSSESSTKSTQTSSFKPSPFSTRLEPKGTVKKWWPDDEEDKK